MSFIPQSGSCMRGRARSGLSHFCFWFGLACVVGSLLFFICLVYLSEAVVREVEFDQVGQVCLFVFNFFFVWLFHMVIFFT